MVVKQHQKKTPLSELIFADHIEVLLRLLFSPSVSVRKLALACVALLSIDERIMSLLLEQASIPPVSGMILLSSQPDFLPSFLKNRDRFMLSLPSHLSKKKLLWTISKDNLGSFSEEELWALIEGPSKDPQNKENEEDRTLPQLPDPMACACGLYFGSPALPDSLTIPAYLYAKKHFKESFSSFRKETVKKLIVKTELGGSSHPDTSKNQAEKLISMRDSVRRPLKSREKLARILGQAGSLKTKNQVKASNGVRFEDFSFKRGRSESHERSERPANMSLALKEKRDTSKGGGKVKSPYRDFSFLIKKRKK